MANTKIKVIVDTDPGVDDAFALFYLVNHPNIELLGATTIFGNVPTSVAADNARFLLKRFGAAHVPVAQGSPAPYCRPAIQCADFVHGQDGLGNTFEMELTGSNDPRPAHIFLCDLIRAHPHEITIVAIAPSTNLALALDHDPEIAHLVKEVLLMGGAVRASGNINPAAEANVYNDPEAAQKVLHAPWKISLFPLDVTDPCIIPTERVASYAEYGELGAYLNNMSHFYQAFYRKNREIDGVSVQGLVPHDLLPVIYITHPELFQFRAGGIRVCTENTELRGHMVIDDRQIWSHPHAWTGLPPVNVCTRVDYEGLFQAFEEQLVAQSVVEEEVCA